jgi:hypothetical protein
MDDFEAWGAVVQGRREDLGFAPFTPFELRARWCAMKAAESNVERRLSSVADVWTFDRYQQALAEEMTRGVSVCTPESEWWVMREEMAA